MVNSVRAVIDRKQRFVAALFCVYRTFGLFVQKWKGELMKYLIHRLYVPP